MFDMARVARINLTEAQTLAIWYHDAIYVPGNDDNEAKSAELAEKHLKGEVDDKTLEVVKKIILDTKDHKATIEESRAVLDLDMSILGANPESYKVYMRLVRKEFNSVPYNKYAKARAKLLEKWAAMAKRNRLYYTLGELLNEYAQENMKMELEVLSDRVDQLED
jgi:predicted metal-dependent HD superfamily phosphohydrolase